MKTLLAIVAGLAATAVTWPAIMWLLIFVGHLIYPDNIHNGIALAGVIAIGPAAGLAAGFVTFRPLHLRWSR